MILYAPEFSRNRIHNKMKTAIQNALKLSIRTRYVVFR